MNTGFFSLPFTVLPSLFRLNLSLVVAFSALTGYMVMHRVDSWKALFVYCGVALLSGAASALNQYQERETDALMQRTRLRPLPAKQCTPFQALLAAATAGPAGFLLLCFGVNLQAALLGLVVLLWYNGVYTPIKRTSRYAVFVGALTGALVPAIGCVAAETHPASRIIALCLFAYLWQISHFFLILLKYGQEYESAGVPTIRVNIGEDYFKRALCCILAATAAGTALFPLLGMISGAVCSAALFFFDILMLTYFCLVLLRHGKSFDTAFAFHVMYLFQGGVFALLIINVL
jgi:heme o synthase